MGLRLAKREGSANTAQSNSQNQSSAGNHNAKSKKSKELCEICKRRGHTAATCYQLEEFVRKVNAAAETSPVQSQPPRIEQPVQPIQQQQAAVSGGVPAQRRFESRPQPRSDQGAPQGCWNCGEMGHRRSECPKPRREQPANGGYNTFANRSQPKATGANAVV